MTKHITWCTVARYDLYIRYLMAKIWRLLLVVAFVLLRFVHHRGVQDTCAAMGLKEEKNSLSNTSPASPPRVVVKNIYDAELETAGYKRAMPRQFTTLTLLGLNFDLTATWLGTTMPAQTHLQSQVDLVSRYWNKHRHLPR